MGTRWWLSRVCLRPRGESRRPGAQASRMSLDMGGSAMIRTSKVVLCVAAMLAISAIGIATAAASPNFGRCKALKEGAYKNSACTKTAAAGKGKYEWYCVVSETPTPENRGITNALKPGSTALLEGVKGPKIECTSETGAGQIGYYYYQEFA